MKQLKNTVNLRNIADRTGRKPVDLIDHFLDNPQGFKEHFKHYLTGYPKFTYKTQLDLLREQRALNNSDMIDEDYQGFFYEGDDGNWRYTSADVGDFHPITDKSVYAGWYNQAFNGGSQDQYTVKNLLAKNIPLSRGRAHAAATITALSNRAYESWRKERGTTISNLGDLFSEIAKLEVLMKNQKM